MHPNVTRALAIVAPVAVYALIAWAFVWPAWQEGTRLFHETAALEQRAATFADESKLVAVLTQRVGESQKREAQQTKLIPHSADLADVMRALSTPIDGSSVIDQTITGGKSGPAVVGETLPFEATPLTVDMTARFDSVFDVLRRAEQLDRLIRIASIRIERPEVDHNARIPTDPLESDVVLASIGLEAIYEVEAPAAEPSAPEGRP